MDDIEQYSRINSVRISGIPIKVTDGVVSKDEDTQKVFLDTIKTRLPDLELSADEIDKIHRLPTKPKHKGPPVILCKFKCSEPKQRLIRARKCLKLPAEDTTSPRISINDDLTAIKVEAAFVARRMKDENVITDTWVSNAKVIIKDKDGKKHRIRHKSDLSQFGPTPIFPVRDQNTRTPEPNPMTSQPQHLRQNRFQQYALIPHDQRTVRHSTPIQLALPRLNINDPPRFNGPATSTRDLNNTSYY